MLNGLGYPSLLAPLFAYLLSRAVVTGFDRMLGSAAPALLLALGAGTATAFTALGLVTAGEPQAGLYSAVAEVAGSIALFCVGSSAGFSMRRRRSSVLSLTRLARDAAKLVIPAAVAVSLAVGFGAANDSSPVAITRTAMALAAALWLSTDAAGLGLIAAGLALTGLSVPGPSSFIAMIIAAILALALAIIGSVDTEGPLGVVKGFAAPLSLGLSIALISAGLPWVAAGLAAGVALGFERRIAADRSSGDSQFGTKGSFYGKALTEASYALAFAIGLGLSLAHIASSLPAVILVAAAVLISAIAGGLMGGGPALALPTEAAAFAVFIAAKNMGLTSDAAIAGAGIAYLIGSPFSRQRSGENGAPETSWIRTLVGVSLKGQSLGAVSFAAAIGRPLEPIRAACIAAAPGTVGPSPNEAEEALVRCVVAGASAGIRVLPSVVISASIADGLARAALERRIDAVILGMGERRASDGNDSKTALDGLLQTFPGSIIALSRPEAFSSSRRLVALAISGAETAPGFKNAIESASLAWGRPSRAMDALMIGGSAMDLVDAAGGAFQERSTRSVQSWRDVPDAISAMSVQKPAFVVFASRPGSKAWNPGHERLPVVLEVAFPGAAITLWFLPAEREALTNDEAAPGDGPAMTLSSLSPSDRTPGERGDLSWPPIIAAAYNAGRVLSAMRDDALVDAIRRLTDAIFPGDRSSSARLAAELSTVARKEPIELSNGILLLHARAHGISMPTLAVGARPAGWPLVALPRLVEIVVVLVSPMDAGPEIHLEALTQVALAFRNLGLAERLLGNENS